MQFFLSRSFWRHFVLTSINYAIFVSKSINYFILSYCQSITPFLSWHQSMKPFCQDVNKWRHIVASSCDKDIYSSGSKSDHLDIDWRFMMRTDLKRRTAEKLKKDPWYSHRMSEKNKFFKYDRKSYEDAVVIRNYGSCDQPNRSVFYHSICTGV